MKREFSNKKTWWVVLETHPQALRRILRQDPRVRPQTMGVLLVPLGHPQEFWLRILGCEQVTLRDVRL